MERHDGDRTTLKRHAHRLGQCHNVQDISAPESIDESNLSAQAVQRGPHHKTVAALGINPEAIVEFTGDEVYYPTVRDQGAECGLDIRLGIILPTVRDEDDFFERRGGVPKEVLKDICDVHGGRLGIETRVDDQDQR